MTPFRLRKVYADLVGADGTVLVAYLGWLRAAGLRAGYAAVEHYAPDGTRRVYRGRPVPGSSGRDADGRVEYAIGTRDGRVFRLVHDDALAPWTVAPISAHIDWQVPVPAARASAGWDGEPALAEGYGYADAVTLLRPPRLVGLRRLRWGRAHLDGRTVVFNAVELADGRRWARTAEWPACARAGGPVVAEGDGAGPRPDDWTVPAPGGALTLRPLRVLHEGEPLDRQRFPGALERWAGRVANGPSHEIRWLSRVERSGAGRGGGLALHESVRFGRA